MTTTTTQEEINMTQSDKEISELLTRFAQAAGGKGVKVVLFPPTRDRRAEAFTITAEDTNTIQDQLYELKIPYGLEKDGSIRIFSTDLVFNAQGHKRLQSMSKFIEAQGRVASPITFELLPVLEEGKKPLGAAGIQFKLNKELESTWTVTDGKPAAEDGKASYYVSHGGESIYRGYVNFEEVSAKTLMPTDEFDRLNQMLKSDGFQTALDAAGAKLTWTTRDWENGRKQEVTLTIQNPSGFFHALENWRGSEYGSAADKIRADAGIVPSPFQG